QVPHVPAPAPVRPAATPPPAPATSSAGLTSTSSYRVVGGDTVEGIAAKTGASQRSLITANGLSAPYLIQIGQVLRVVKPVATAANTFEGRTYPAATVAAATAARNALARSHVPTRAQMRATIAATAARYGVDQRLALAVAYLESGWDQRQVSVANAVGAMQVIPSSGQWASDLAGRPLNLLVAQDNATAGVVILRALVQSSPSLEVAIAGYYQGLGSVQQNGMYADTARYVANVTALMTTV
ncbi:MAG: transglycosylase SLT domain-containing protein, partial [Lapillicoccus sp.]